MDDFGANGIALYLKYKALAVGLRRMACWFGYRWWAWQAGIGRRHIKRSVAGRSMYVGWMDLAHHNYFESFKLTTVSQCAVIGNISTGCTYVTLHKEDRYFKSLAKVSGSQET